MKFKINDKIQFIDLAEHIKHGKSYNVTILEAKVRETGFTDRQLEQLAELLVPIKQDIAELKRDVVEIKQDIVEIKKDIIELRKDLNEVRELPIIIEALKNSKKK